MNTTFSPDSLTEVKHETPFSAWSGNIVKIIPQFPTVSQETLEISLRSTQRCLLTIDHLLRMVIDHFSLFICVQLLSELVAITFFVYTIDQDNARMMSLNTVFCFLSFLRVYFVVTPPQIFNNKVRQYSDIFI